MKKVLMIILMFFVSMTMVSAINSTKVTMVIDEENHIKKQMVIEEKNNTKKINIFFIRATFLLSNYIIFTIKKMV